MRSHSKALLAIAALCALLLVPAGTALAVGPTVGIPSVETVGYTTAEIKASFDPGDEQGYYTTFEYAELSDESWSGCFGFENFFPAGSGSMELTKELTGLKPGTEYAVRLCALREDLGAEERSPEPNPAFTTEAVDPPIVSGDDASSVSAFGAHFSGEVEVTNADPAFEANCNFDYITQQLFDENEANSLPGFEGTSSIACDPNPVKGSESQPVEVEADPDDLEPNTTYRLRLRAKNLGGETIDEAPATFKTTAIAPTVNKAFHHQFGSGKVVFAGLVNPRNSAITDCHFEYGLTESYGQSVPCEALPPTDNQASLVRAELASLTPDATYHFKLSMTNAVGTSESADKSFVVRDASAASSCANAGRLGVGLLPDCRAWEMVSPQEKEGADVSPNSWRVRVAEDGSAVSFMSLGSFGDVETNTAYGVEFVAERGGTSWETHAITPRMDARAWPPGTTLGFKPAYHGEFSADLDKGVFLSHTGITDEDPNVGAVSNLYLRDNLLTPGGGDYALLSQCPGCAGPLPLENPFDHTSGLAFAGASEDFSHVIFESTDNLTGETTGDEPKLYEWLAVSGDIRLVGVLPDSACGSPPCFANEVIAGSGAGGARPDISGLVPTNLPHYTMSMNTISRDGSRIFFTVGPFGGSSSVYELPSGELYRRENGATTVQINVSERTVPDPGGHQPAEFGAASADGSKVYFLSTEQLTDDDSDSSKDLYLADLDQPAGERLTLVSDGEAPSHVVGVGQGGDVVYFLGGSHSDDPDLPEPGSTDALYVWDGETRLVADYWLGSRPPGHHWGDWTTTTPRLAYDVGGHSLRVTPDGQHAVFMSYLPTTAQETAGYDNSPDSSGPGCGLESPDQDYCVEVYLYDHAENELTCVSCNPSGERPQGDATFHREELFGVSTFLEPVNFNSPVTEDGDRVFFSSRDSLVPEDQNGYFDVYQYEVSTGGLSLISSGRGAADSMFMDTTPDGNDVFFTTREQLSRWDTDASFDLYDARVGGGLPEPPFPPPACVGDACQPAPGELDDSTPASSTFEGPGSAAAVPTSNCARPAARAQRLGRKVKRLRGAAKRIRNDRKEKRTLRNAKRLRRDAKRLSRSAKRCRRARANRRAGR